jgi:hypothetical protein
MKYMKMIKIITTITIFTLLSIVLVGCSEDEPQPKFNTDLLIGDWKVVEMNGVSFLTTPEWLVVTIKSNGELNNCVEYASPANPTDGFCDYWNWEWQNATNSKIAMSEVNDGNSQTFADVIILTSTNMELNLSNTVNSNVENWKLVKIK